MSHPAGGEPFPGAAPNPSPDQQAAAAHAVDPSAAAVAAPAESAIAGLEIPEHLRGIITPAFARMAGGLTQREVDIAALVADGYAATLHQPAAEFAAAAASQQVTPVEAAPAKPEKIKSNEWFGKYPARYYYSWGETDASTSGDAVHSFPSSPGEQLYDTMEEQDDFPEVGLPAETADELAKPDSKHQTDGLHEVVAFSELPDDPRIRDLIEMPEGVNPNMNLVVMDYEAAGYVKTADGKGRVLDRVGVQIIMSENDAMDMDLSIQKNGMVVARGAVRQAFKAELEATEGTADELNAKKLTGLLSPRYEQMKQYFDEQPTARGVIASNVEGVGPSGVMATAIDGYRTQNVPIRNGAGRPASAQAPADNGGGVIGGAWRLGKKLRNR